MGKERDFGKEIDALQKQISDLRKANRKTKRHESVKCLLSNYFLWMIVLFFVLGITMFLTFYPITDDKQVSVVLAFVGIASTFVVVSNYAQVQDIKKEFDSKIKENIKNATVETSDEIYRNTAALYLANAHNQIRLNDVNFAFTYTVFAIEAQLTVSKLEVENIDAILNNARSLINRSDANRIHTTREIADKWIAMIEKHLSKNAYFSMRGNEIVLFLQRLTSN